MKEIKRYCLDTKKVETFVEYGQWADGHLAYSLIINGNCYDGDEGSYVQVRQNGKLVMFHI